MTAVNHLGAIIIAWIVVLLMGASLMVYIASKIERHDIAKHNWHAPRRNQRTARRRHG